MTNDNGQKRSSFCGFKKVVWKFSLSSRSETNLHNVSGEGEVTPAHQQTRELRVQIVMYQVTRLTCVNLGGYRAGYSAMLTCGVQAGPVGYRLRDGGREHSPDHSSEQVALSGPAGRIQGGIVSDII